MAGLKIGIAVSGLVQLQFTVKWIELGKRVKRERTREMRRGMQEKSGKKGRRKGLTERRGAHPNIDSSKFFENSLKKTSKEATCIK